MRDGEGDDGGRPNGPGLHGLKVLVAEDEALLALELELTLGELGCTVLPAAPSVAGALAILGAERPDVALLDVNLADGSAAPVAEALAIAGVPFAVMTGDDAGRIGEAALRGAPHLGKPYGDEALRATLARLTSVGVQARERGTETEVGRGD
jgi:CheY-like chemotaxis protein